jgi:hypothetical protein
MPLIVPVTTVGAAEALDEEIKPKRNETKRVEAR